MPCTNCGKERVVGRGLCSGCYTRLRRNGSVKRKYVINSGKCSVDGCQTKAFSKNLCAHHYNKAESPIKIAWKGLRSRCRGEYPLHWDDYEKFLDDIGERPTPKHQLRRIDPSKHWSKANVHWLSPITRSDYMTKEERADYSREWTLQRRFKITGDQFREMLASQGGVCAICQLQEKRVSRNGNAIELSVDHCHGKGHVRGLLCVACNRGLGYFGDDLERLRRAISYLERS